MSWIEKYYPVIANINILVILVLWWFGIDARGFTASLLGSAVIPNLLLFYYSKKRHYCLWHRILLANTIFYGLLHMTEKYLMLLNIEFNYYFYIALVVTVISLLASTYLSIYGGSIKCSTSLKKSPKRFVLRNLRKDGLGRPSRTDIRTNGLSESLHQTHS